MVNSAQTELVNKYRKYGVNAFPKILLFTAEKRMPDIYEGVMKYTDISNYLNIYSETFVTTGGSVE